LNNQLKRLLENIFSPKSPFLAIRLNIESLALRKKDESLSNDSGGGGLGHLVKIKQKKRSYIVLSRHALWFT
jgi:hypothetical protein